MVLDFANAYDDGQQDGNISRSSDTVPLKFNKDLSEDLAIKYNRSHNNLNNAICSTDGGFEMIDHNQSMTNVSQGVVGEDYSMSFGTLAATAADEEEAPYNGL